MLKFYYIPYKNKSYALILGCNLKFKFIELCRVKLYVKNNK